MIMNENKQTTITSGQYTFQITDNTLLSRTNAEIYGHIFKIGSADPDCVEISIINENNKSIDARMRFLHNTGPECSNSNGHMYNMIKTLLQYVYEQMPTLTHINFDDKTHIDCAAEDAIPLYYFSIVFNGETWYEKYFNATQSNHDRHEQYRKRVAEFLYEPECKTHIQFGRFASLFNKREEEMVELVEYYNNANNFNEFFQSIPEQDRCRLVGPWIQQFMKYILSDVFYSDDWIIQFPLEITGENNETQKYYYPEDMNITNNFQSKNICLFPEDI